jgi:hypothetical protein
MDEAHEEQPPSGLPEGAPEAEPMGVPEAEPDSEVTDRSPEGMPGIPTDGEPPSGG